MSEGTKIEWATHTFNPWTGCFPVSPGCLHCYMMALLKRFGKDGRKRTRTSESYWKQAARWNREASNDAARQRVFPSLCDWLDDEVPIEWLADFLKLIHDTPNLDWLLLTKRPEKFFLQTLTVALQYADSHNDESFLEWLTLWSKEHQPPHNVWIGASAEDQKRADERIPELLKIPAAVRFLSVEPLLGPVDLSTSEKGDVMAPVDWVIVGGESGPGARPCNVEWIRDIVRQCKAADVPCFVKQLGSRPMLRDAPPPTYPPKRREYIDFGDRLKLNHPKGGDQAEWPEDLRVREFPNGAHQQPPPTTQNNLCEKNSQ